MKNKIILGFVLCFLVFSMCYGIDIYPNHIRGTVYVSENNPAPSGTEITIKVTSGEHAGFRKTVEVDSELVPPFLRGNGFYDTGDSVYFSTGDTFAVIIDNGTHYGSASGTFHSYGDGEFNSSKVNVYLNQYEKEDEDGGSSGGGSGGGGTQIDGYDEEYEYKIPETEKENIEDLVEAGAPPTEPELPPEIFSKYKKEEVEYAEAEKIDIDKILISLLIMFWILTVTILYYKKRRKRG